jgi:hypothetical protein
MYLGELLAGDNIVLKQILKDFSRIFDEPFENQIGMYGLNAYLRDEFYFGRYGNTFVCAATKPSSVFYPYALYREWKDNKDLQNVEYRASGRTFSLAADTGSITHQSRKDLDWNLRISLTFDVFGGVHLVPFIASPLFALSVPKVFSLKRDNVFEKMDAIRKHVEEFIALHSVKYFRGSRKDVADFLRNKFEEVGVGYLASQVDERDMADCLNLFDLLCYAARLYNKTGLNDLQLFKMVKFLTPDD